MYRQPAASDRQLAGRIAKIAVESVFWWIVLMPAGAVVRRATAVERACKRAKLPLRR